MAPSGTRTPSSESRQLSLPISTRSSPEFVFARVFRRLQIGRAAPDFHIEFRPFSGLRSNIRRIDPAAFVTMVPVFRPGYVADAVIDPDAMDIEVHALHHGYLRGLKARGGELVTASVERASVRSAAGELDTIGQSPSRRSGVRGRAAGLARHPFWLQPFGHLPLIGVPMEERSRQSQEKNLEIKPHGPVSDVVKVVRDALHD